jgi:hypothetical protein
MPVMASDRREPTQQGGDEHEEEEGEGRRSNDGGADLPRQPVSVNLRRRPPLAAAVFPGAATAVGGGNPNRHPPVFIPSRPSRAAGRPHADGPRQALAAGWAACVGRGPAWAASTGCRWVAYPFLYFLSFLFYFLAVQYICFGYRSLFFL